MINDYRALINMRAGETNDEYDVVWKITRAVSIDTFVGIEKQLKAHKTHRNIVDIESRTINNTQAD